MDSTTSKSFFGFLFNMKDPETNTMNMLQYSFIALIPIIILLKIVNIIPEANESKGSIEILFEIILQLIIIIIGIVIIHRFTIYFNTLSKVPYPEIQTFSIVLSIILTLFIVHSKINDKVSILVERVRPNKTNAKSTQKTTNSSTTNTSANTSSMNTSMNTSMNSSMISSMNPMHSHANQPKQTLPDYNEMYNNQPITLQNTTLVTAPNAVDMGPIAANEAFSSFGTSF